MTWPLKTKDNFNPLRFCAPGSSPSGSSPEERHQRILELAYGYASRRSFACGGELDDWLAAEREVEQIDRSGAHR
jgi:hypothetical protein